MIRTVLIDLILHSALIAYYFLNIKHFIVVNIINFIPILFILLFIVYFIAYCGKHNKKIIEESIKKYGKDKIEKIIKGNLYNKITNYTMLFLLLITGYKIILIIYILTLVMTSAIKDEFNKVMESK